jgi:hypothetical protein
MGIVVGVAVNILILIGLITNLRRNQAKLSAMEQCLAINRHITH